MDLITSTPKALARPMQYLTSATAVVIAVGLIGSVMAAINAVQINRDLLLSKAVTAAAVFTGEEISNLSGQSTDISNPTYKSLRRRLVSIRQGNDGTRFVYLIGKKKRNDVFFYADSESEQSTSYSPPGSSYPEASKLLVSTFYNDNPILEGPLEDSFGNWMTAAAPVKDETGKIVAVLGIDIPATEYYKQVAIYALIPLLLASIPVAVLVYNRRIARKEHEITELKTQFVSIASHELRSPLTGTLWGIQSLLKSKHRADQEKTMTAIYNNIASSLATVNEILDFTIFERNQKSSFQRDIVDLRLATQDVIKLYGLSAEEKKIEITPAGRWPKQALVIGDQGALKRAIGNLLSNAIKYSPEGSKIQIAIRTEKGKHVIGVKDHGIGIPKPDQRKVLGGYFRSANAAKVKTYGTGMGLWLSRTIVEQHQGRLWLRSKENQGSTFFISLPAKKDND